MRPPPPSTREKSFFELLPKGKLLAALSMVVLLVAIICLKRHAGGALDGLRGFLASPATAPARPADQTRRVRLQDPPPASAGKAP